MYPKALEKVVALAPLLSPPVGEAGFRSGLSLSQFRHLGPKTNAKQLHQNAGVHNLKFPEIKTPRDCKEKGGGNAEP